LLCLFCPAALQRVTAAITLWQEEEKPKKKKDKKKKKKEADSDSD
jgi:hypothetical protein